MGEYTGYIVKKPKINSYCWEYYSSFKNYEKISIDSTDGGTLLRFVNDLENHNAEVLYIPVKN